MTNSTDANTIIKNISTSEVQVMQTPKQINKRNIYFMLLNENSGAANTLTFKIYQSDGTTLINSFNISLSANQNRDIGKNINTPIIVIDPDRIVKLVATAASIDVVMDYIDE